MNDTTHEYNEDPARVEVHAKQGNGIRGKITLNEDVVATIAGLAAREVAGIHSLGRWRLISIGDNPTRGVDAEVGKKQAAFDLDAVIEYGADIRAVASQLRERIADEVDKMTGREVVEVNINVVGLHFRDESTSSSHERSGEPAPRVI
jgi:uncharacterized alkaline shock family protein YloU